MFEWDSDKDQGRHGTVPDRWCINRVHVGLVSHRLRRAANKRDKLTGGSERAGERQLSQQQREREREREPDSALRKKKKGCPIARTARNRRKVESRENKKKKKGTLALLACLDAG